MNERTFEFLVYEIIEVLYRFLAFYGFDRCFVFVRHFTLFVVKSWPQISLINLLLF